MAVRVLLLSCVVFLSCKTQPPAPTDSFDRRAMLTSIADLVILPALRDARTAAAAFATAPSQATWRAFMAEWQKVEVLQLGPAALASSSAGGLGLRESIYV